MLTVDRSLCSLKNLDYLQALAPILHRIYKIHRTSIAQGDTRRGGNLLRSTLSEYNELNKIYKIS